MVTVMLYIADRIITENLFRQSLSHNYSDIGTIEVDAYINTRRAQVDAILTVDSDESTPFMWFQRHRTAIAAHSRRQAYRRDKLSMIFTKIGV